MRLDRIEQLADAEADWRSLAEASGNPFTTWEWASIWWRHFGDGRELRAFRCLTDDGRTAGILPLQLASQRGLRTLRFIGSRPADEQAPLAAPEDRPAVAAAFARLLADGDGFDLALAERLPEEGGWAGALGGRLLRSEPSPEIALTEPGWDEFLAARSSNFRQQVRKFERRLVRDNGLSYRLADDPARLDDDMTTLIRLHHARWGTDTTAFPPELEPFQRELAAEALRAGWLRLWFAEVDGRPVAAWYGFRLGGADWFYQQGRDPDWERASIGFVLTAHTIREAFADGVRRYRFLLGDEEYKSRFATSEPEVRTVAAAGTVKGALALAAVRLIRRAPVPLRTRIGRRVERRA
jgi:CelD/BcsL family acetyltransferase involved in cellulose biosynthesis